MQDPQVRQPSWRRGYLAPSYRHGAKEHAYALQVLTEILGGGGSSRLYRRLVIDGKLAISAGSHYDSDNLGPGKFLIWASPRPGVAMAAIEEAVDAELAAIEADGVTPDEVSRAIKRMTASAVYARDSFTAGARVLGTALAIGQTIEDVESWPERIAAVTPEQVKAAARAVFIKKHSVTSLLLAGSREKKE